MRETIPPWALEKGFDVVIWTGLQSNCKQESGKDFSIDSAIDHLQRLHPAGKAIAAEYVWRAPDFVQTALRSALQIAPWFPQPAIK